MSNIHPTAVVENGALIAPDAVIGPFCHVGRHVRIAKGTKLISHVSVLGRTTLGEHNILWPQSTLGGDPQDLKYTGEEVHLIVGDHNDIRENVTIHLGTGNGGGATRVGSDNLFMVGSHIAHDCVIGNHIILANNVTLAGHVVIEDHANIAGLAGVHHYCTIGQFAYVGGMTRVVKDVPPFVLYEGDPARERGINSIGLERHGFPAETILLLKEAYKRLFLRTEKHSQGLPTSNRRKWYAFKTWFRADSQAAKANGDVGGPSTLSERLQQLEAEFPNNECLQILVQFLRNRSVGMSGRYRESLRKDDRRKKGFAALQPEKAEADAATVGPAAPAAATASDEPAGASDSGVQVGAASETPVKAQG